MLKRRGHLPLRAGGAGGAQDLLEEEQVPGQQGGGALRQERASPGYSELLCV